MIYEDVQRPDESAEGMNNGWSSSEFESYDEQSDTDTKPRTRSKVGTSTSLNGGVAISKILSLR